MAMEPLASTPAPPYYAVIFSSLRTADDAEDQAVMAEQMATLAAGQAGLLGVETPRYAQGVGIAVFCWDSMESIWRWGRHAEHRIAQQGGRYRWYECFRLRVCRVEEDRAFGRGDGAGV